MSPAELELRADVLRATLDGDATGDLHDEVRALRHLVRALAIQLGSHGLSVSRWAWQEAERGGWRVEVSTPDARGERRVRPVPAE